VANYYVALAFQIVFFIILAGGIIVLQIFLSRKEKRWPGLILPGLSLLCSLLIVLSLVVFSTQTQTSGGYITADGTYIQTEETVHNEVTAADLAVVVPPFLLSNIPTVVLLAIYAACREKRKRKLAVDRMSAQDLE